MKRILFYILILTLLVPVFSKAQEYTLLEPLPCVEGTGNNCKTGETIEKISLETYVGYIFKFSIALAAALAVIMIIYGGFEYMLSESLTNKSSARTRIQNAITGLIMVLASYLILRTIDPRLVQVYTKIPPLEIKLDKTIVSFQDKLVEDLSKANADAIVVVNKANEQKTIAQENLVENESKFKNGEIDEEEYQIQKAIDQQTINQKNIEISREITGSVSRNVLKDLSIDLRVDPQTNWYGATDPDWTLIDKRLTEVKTLYDKYIKQLEDSGNTEGVFRLKTDRTFYLDQIAEEGEMIKEVDKSYQDQTGTRFKSRDVVAKRLSSYQDEYANLNKPKTDASGTVYKTDPRLEEQYKSILEIRINYLRAYLEKPNTPK